MAVLLELKDVAEKQEDATTVAACKACSCLGPPSLLPLGSQDCSLSPANDASACTMLRNNIKHRELDLLAADLLAAFLLRFHRLL